MTASVVVCTWQGPREEPPEERDAALTLGRRTAAALGAELRWLVVGEPPADLAAVATAQAVAGVDHIDGAGVDDTTPDALVDAIVQYCTPRELAVLLVNQTFGSRLVAPRVAARLGAGVVMNATGIEATGGPLEVTASAFGGDTRVVYSLGAGTNVVALLPNSVEAEAVAGAAEPPVETVTVELSGVQERIRVVEPARAEGARLEDAEVIVAAGRGIGAQEKLALIDDLARELGGMTGVSRPLVDVGWIDSSHQVGLTGRITRPALYLAVGISGATQHMVGCTAAKTIVAVNTDPDAAIFHHARFGVVDDCNELLPELIRAVKELGGS